LANFFGVAAELFGSVGFSWVSFGVLRGSRKGLLVLGDVSRALAMVGDPPAISATCDCQPMLFEIFRGGRRSERRWWNVEP
jgi:hypothetical protein